MSRFGYVMTTYFAVMLMGVLSIVSGILILIFVNEPKKVEKENADELKSEAGLFSLADAVKLFKMSVTI